jgi:hypothetical protein
MIRRIGGQQIINEAEVPGVELGIGQTARTQPILSPYKKPYQAQQLARKVNYNTSYMTDKNEPLTLENFPLTAYTGEALY